MSEHTAKAQLLRQRILRERFWHPAVEGILHTLAFGLIAGAVFVVLNGIALGIAMGMCVVAGVLEVGLLVAQHRALAQLVVDMQEYDALDLKGTPTIDAQEFTGPPSLIAFLDELAPADPRVEQIVADQAPARPMSHAEVAQQQAQEVMDARTPQPVRARTMWAWHKGRALGYLHHVLECPGLPSEENAIVRAACTLLVHGAEIPGHPRDWREAREAWVQQVAMGKTDLSLDAWTDEAKIFG